MKIGKHALTLITALACVGAANGAEMTSPALTLRWDDTDASPVSLQNAAGEELLGAGRKSGGFFLAPDERGEGSRLRFTHIAPAGEGAWLRPQVEQNLVLMRRVARCVNIPAGHHFTIPAQGPCATFDPNWNPGPSLPRTGELHGPAHLPSFSFQTPSKSVWLEIGLQKSGTALPLQIHPPSKTSAEL